MTLITHNIDGGRISKTYEQMSKEDKPGVVLKLIIQEENSIKNVGQTKIEGCRDLLIKFSSDGLLFAFLHLNTEDNTDLLKVYEIDDNIEGLIKKIQNEVSHLMQYEVEHGVDEEENKNKKIIEIMFDDNNRFVILRGKTHL